MKTKKCVDCDAQISAVHPAIRCPQCREAYNLQREATRVAQHPTKKCLDCSALIGAKSANPRCNECTQAHLKAVSVKNEFDGTKGWLGKLSNEMRDRRIANGIEPILAAPLGYRESHAGNPSFDEDCDW